MKPHRRHKRRLLIIGAIAAIGAAAYLQLPKKTAKIPKAPMPEAFPKDCPKIPLANGNWRGISFKYPESYIAEISTGPHAEKEGLRFIGFTNRQAEGWSTIAESIGIAEARKTPSIAKVIDAFWVLPQGGFPDISDLEPVSPNGIKDTFRRMEVSGRKALLYLARESALMPVEHFTWFMLIANGKVNYMIDGQSMFSPYRLENGDIRYSEEYARHNKELNCIFFSFLMSLELDGPAP